MKDLKSKMVEVVRSSAEEFLGGSHLAMILGACESPIEKLMATALMSRGEWSGSLQMTHPMGVEHLKRFAKDVSLEARALAAPQVSIGPYRVDFAIAIDRPSAGMLIVAVECDGHDYHEKTREQAARDKARDRYLAQQDVVVLRFTGSEIWADAGWCAQEALDLVNSKWVDGLHSNYIQTQGAKA